MIFEYPESRTERLHGPEGYTSYESFRPWLRDEFTFRCVYCLKRETWGQVTGEFELDHFEPQSVVPDRAVDYTNLVYSCRRCNVTKQDRSIDDPFHVLSSSSVTLVIDGELIARSVEALRLIRQLDLNSPSLRKWRVMWMRIIKLAMDRDTELYRQLTGFPFDLPDLSQLRPPVNSRPEGLDLSWHAKRAKGQQPEHY